MLTLDTTRNAGGTYTVDATPDHGPTLRIILSGVASEEQAEARARAAWVDTRWQFQPIPAPTYTLWSLDVWGNARDGFEVNDRSCLDRAFTIPAKDHSAPTDREIRAALRASGYIPGHCAKLAIEDLEGHIEVDLARNSRPLFTIESNEIPRVAPKP